MANLKITDMNSKTLIFMALAALALSACRQGAAEPVAPADTVAADTVAAQRAVRPTWQPPTPAEEAVPVAAAVTSTSAKPKSASSGQKSATASGKAEKLYVETEGAQGRVWGYVTMRGDRGSGTIHDWDENTLTVSVTRHGNELFAVDQNSRQYVFRLR